MIKHQFDDKNIIHIFRAGNINEIFEKDNEGLKNLILFVKILETMN